MQIYLMQHGPALPKEQDPKQGLSAEGKARVHAAGKALKKMGCVFDAILCSPKKRSTQTAAIVAQEVGFAEGKILETEKVKAMAPPQETLKVLSELSGADQILVAGHLPSVGEVASALLAEQTKISVQFEMGACCCIETDTPTGGAGRLRWFLLPEHLEWIAG
ncbi:MAG: phosphohistidine phosphatase SixA [Deltaproteobacteria bacterium]|nr:phosphohistidine phosphatase SixA [Deltaproteobacteria bacterium]